MQQGTEAAGAGGRSGGRSDGFSGPPWRIFFRHDLSRAASWLSLLFAAAAFSGVPAGVPPAAFGFVAAAAAAVVAIGELPADFPTWDAGLLLRRDRRWRFSRRNSALPWAGHWLAARLLWPLLGLLIAGCCVPGESLLLLGAGLPAILLAGLTTAGMRLCGLSAADAATATLLAGWLAAAGVAAAALWPVAAGWLLPVGLLEWLAVAAGFIGLAQWQQLAGSGPIAGLLPRQQAATAGRGLAATEPLTAVRLIGVLPACSVWRRSLRNASLLLSLGGMVGWLLLQPDLSGRYVLFAASLFGAFAIPAAALLDGHDVRVGWRRLLAERDGIRGLSAVDPVLLAGRLVRPTPLAQAAVVLGSHAVFLLWPPLVVAIVAVGHPAAGTALATAGLLAGGAAAVSGGCLVCRRLAPSGELSLAVSLCLLAAGLWLWWTPA